MTVDPASNARFCVNVALSAVTGRYPVSDVECPSNCLCHSSTDSADVRGSFARAMCGLVRDFVLVLCQPRMR